MVRINLLPRNLRAKRAATLPAKRKGIVCVSFVAAILVGGLAGPRAIDFIMLRLPLSRKADRRTLSPVPSRTQELPREQTPPPAPAPVPPPLAESAPAEIPAVPSGPQPFTPAVAKLKSGELVWAVGNYYRVPACLLWAIWKKESSLLLTSQRENRLDWWPAAETIANGGKCVEQYGEKCAKHWYALVSLCKQVRRGAPICVPDQVWSSKALAVGPLQHMPGELAKPCRDNPAEYCFTEDAQDFDGDGVFDPWKLADAMAATAFELGKYYEQAVRQGERRRWRFAAIRYYGMPASNPLRYAYYYDGLEQSDARSGGKFRKGVKQYWQECCRETGRCRVP